MRANQFLTEATQKGREYNHLEDLVTFEGSKGALKAAEILTRLGQDSKDVSIKWDGNPTIFWGREPNGQFVMTGKNGWGRQKTTSSGELQDFILNTGKGEDWRKDFAGEMAGVFEILEANTSRYEGLCVWRFIGIMQAVTSQMRAYSLHHQGHIHC